MYRLIRSCMRVHKPLVRKFVPGERDPFRGRRITRAKRKTERVPRQQAELREVFAVGLELYQRTESRLTKKEPL
jgi:hypothetical protein